MKLFDFNHPFFEPVWRRVAVVGACIGWGAFEFANGTPAWGTLFVGIGLFAGYNLFLARPPAAKDDEGQDG